jgi:hypothetical protein
MIYPSNPRGYFDADGGVPFLDQRPGAARPGHDRGQARGDDAHPRVGDSFTFGEGREEDTYLRWLEKALAGRSGAARRS